MKLIGLNLDIKMVGMHIKLSAMKRYFFRMNTFSLWLNTARIHLICWCIYIVYESILTGIFANQFGAIENYLVHYSLNIGLFYFHAYLMKTIMSGRKRINNLLLIPTILLEVISYILLLAVLNHYFTSYNQQSFSKLLGIDYRFLIGAIYRSLFFIMISSGYFYLKSFIDGRQALQDLKNKRLKDRIVKDAIEKELVMAQNAYLRAQVSPHLFFNALSFIHRRIRKIDETSGDMIINIADMMRYAINNTNEITTSTLGEEIEQVDNLINILQAVHEKKFNLKLLYSPSSDLTIEVIPMILITLAENMYKHGDLSRQDFPGLIEIDVKDRNITIRTENIISARKTTHSLNTGLLNLRERLKNSYHDRAEILWEEKKGIFYLRISLSTIGKNIICLD